MANWKKIIVSGSAISQLNNDSSFVDANITGSNLITASVAANVITFTKGDNTTFDLTVATGSATSASFATSASHAEFADNARDAVSSSHALRADIADSVAFEDVSGKPTLVSGSSQITISSTTGYTSFSSSIATDITSNTTEISSVSSSLSTRITAQEDFSSSLDATFATDAELSALSSSAASALTTLSSSASTSRQAIAGDLSTVSSSFSTRITAQEDFSSSLDATFVTEAELVAATASLSASLAVDIATNTSDIADLVTDSGSFSTRVTSLEEFSSSLDSTFATDADVTSLSSSAASALTSLSSSASTSRDALATDISNNTSDISTLNGKTLISGSTFSSPSQGTLRATINGVATDVDLGLQAADNVTFADAIITGDLTVQGTASFQNTTDLDVADRFIRLASGSNANGDGGIVVQQDSPANGEAFAFDTAESRWGVTSSFDPTTNTIVPDAFMTTNVTGADNDPTGIAGRYQKNGNIFVGNTGDIWIYS